MGKTFKLLAFIKEKMLGWMLIDTIQNVINKVTFWQYLNKKMVLFLGDIHPVKLIQKP